MRTGVYMLAPAVVNPQTSQVPPKDGNAGEGLIVEERSDFRSMGLASLPTTSAGTRRFSTLGKWSTRPAIAGAGPVWSVAPACRCAHSTHRAGAALTPFTMRSRRTTHRC
jgi:hypothetical protein